MVTGVLYRLQSLPMLRPTETQELLKANSIDKVDVDKYI
jgi:hypothetical protein